MNNSPNTSRRLHPALAGLIVIAMIGMAGAGVAALNAHNDDAAGSASPVATTTPVSTSDATTPSNGNASTPAATAGTYKDGTYTASVNYFTPDGQEPLTVKLTIANDVVTSSDVSANTISREGQQYFNRFSSYYQSDVVGQKITDVASLSRVAGASLTTDGFNQAVQQIMQNAAG